jgi:predicted aminopeptidase
VTSPLLTESLALADNAQQMRTAFMLAVNNQADTEKTSQQLLTLHAVGQEQIAKLRGLAAYPGIYLELESIAESETSFARVLEDSLAAHGRQLAATAATQARLEQYSARRRQVDALLLSVINRANGAINRYEDSAKVSVQTGAATVDSLGDLLSKLLNETFQALA